MNLLLQTLSLVTHLPSMMESTMAQFFVGKDTLMCDAYGIKSQKHFINRGAMDTIITDGEKYEISKKVSDLLRSLFIKQYESEPYHQHQNKAD